MHVQIYRKSQSETLDKFFETSSALVGGSSKIRAYSMVGTSQASHISMNLPHAKIDGWCLLSVLRYG